MDSIFRGTLQDSLYYLFSKINHSFFQYIIISYNQTTYNPPTYKTNYLKVDVQGYLKGVLSTINHKTASPKYYEPQLTRDWI